MELLDVVGEAGLVALIIFMLMGAAIRWFVVERNRVLDLVVARDKELRELRESQLKEAVKARDEYRDFGEGSRDVMRELTTQSRALESKIDVWMAAMRPGIPG